MSEFFLELFSEEIPATLQKTARDNLQKNFVDFLKKEEIKFKDSISVVSTPNRLIVYCENISQKIIKAEAVIRGPSCLLYTSPSPRDRQKSRMPSSA